MKIGMVLEGGAMRGMYTAGVLDVMLEQNLLVDTVIGVSAGAVFGCNYKSRQIGRVIRYNTAYCKDPRFMSLRSLFKTGDLYGEQFCYHDIPDTLDPFDTETFRKSPVEFYVTCTDVETGKAVYHRCTDGGAQDIQWMRASASMPVVSRVVRIGNYGLLDGGMADSIPVEQLFSLGCDKGIVVLTQPKGYVKQKSSMLPLIRFGMRKYPAMVACMAKRHLVYNRALERVEQGVRDGRLFVVQPSRSIGIHRIERDPEKLRQAYAIGRTDAAEKLEALRAFLAKPIE